MADKYHIVCLHGVHITTFDPPSCGVLGQHRTDSRDWLYCVEWDDDALGERQGGLTEGRGPSPPAKTLSRRERGLDVSGGHAFDLTYELFSHSDVLRAVDVDHLWRQIALQPVALLHQPA